MSEPARPRKRRGAIFVVATVVIGSVLFVARALPLLSSGSLLWSHEGQGLLAIAGAAVLAILWFIAR